MTSGDASLRTTLAAALAELEANGSVTVRGARDEVVTLLCRRLVEAGWPAAANRDARSPLALAEFLERAADAWPGDAAWHAEIGMPLVDVHAEEARRQAALTQLRLAQGSLTMEQAATYWRAIARGLRERGEG